MNHVWLSASIIMYTIWYIQNSNRVHSKHTPPEGFLTIYCKMKTKWVCEVDYKTAGDHKTAGILTASIQNECSAKGRIHNKVSIFRFNEVADQWLLDRPPPGWTILLTDVAYNNADRITSFGAIIVNRIGFVMGIKSQQYHGRINFGAEEAEILAVEPGVDWCYSLNFTNLLVFSDSLNTVNYLQQQTFIKWQLLPIKRKLLTDRGTGQCMFCYIPRELNCVAHNAAE